MIDQCGFMDDSKGTHWCRMLMVEEVFLLNFAMNLKVFPPKNCLLAFFLRGRWVSGEEETSRKMLAHTKTLWHRET